ncbi:MAG TPA: permease prefix domain 1-containing protein, partial [Gemmatimonadaceae bacterium]|nr:permease prefix domain 1-containing protein [Gemmatimonadaceae bacterium]
MSMLTNFRRRVNALLHKDAAERELDRELQFHIERETEKYITQGMSPGEAHRRARLAFGSVEATKETYRDGRGTRWLEDLIGDTRLALRSLRRNPGFAAAAIITLTLGIGANVSIFTAVNAVLIRKLPYANP